MRIVQFKQSGNEAKLGFLRNDKVVDVSAIDETLPRTLVELLEQGEEAVEKLKNVKVIDEYVYKVDEVKLLPPVTKPDKILGVALNYKEACDKSNIPYPAEPITFSKFASTIVGPYDEIKKPSASEQVDWEVELVVVIGKKAQNVKAEDAFDYVFGYTITQDLTAKDWTTRNGGQFLMCKNMDNFCPLGPCVVTKDEFGDPHNKWVKTWVNGVLKQNGNTKELVHRIDKLIEYLSSAITLLPGDLICTGTPSGVGASQNPPQFLQKGDRLESDIQFLGWMSNKIV